MRYDYRRLTYTAYLDDTTCKAIFKNHLQKPKVRAIIKIIIKNNFIIKSRKTEEAIERKYAKKNT